MWHGVCVGGGGGGYVCKCICRCMGECASVCVCLWVCMSGVCLQTRVRVYVCALARVCSCLRATALVTHLPDSFPLLLYCMLLS